MEKEKVISGLILAKVAEGMKLADAIDAVLGPDTFDRLVTEIYDHFKARGVA